MSKRNILVGVVLSAIAGMASAGAFDGPYVQLGIGGASTETQTSYPSVLGNLPGFNTGGQQ